MEEVFVIKLAERAKKESDLIDKLQDDVKQLVENEILKSEQSDVIIES